MTRRKNITRWTILLLLWLPWTASCNERSVSRCEELMDQLQQLLKTDCPDTNLACGGNPNLDTPVVSYSKRHHGKVKELEAASCPLPDLGSAPVFCNSGYPQCMPEYKCCNSTTCVPQNSKCAARDGGR